jgi:iron complex transport system substrate-binding protein
VRRTPTIILTVLFAFALVATACGDDGGDTVVESGERPETTEAAGDGQSTDDAAFPVTVADDNGEVTIEAEPTAIVSVSPTGTEMLFAIGAGDQVVAVDEYSYYPDEAPVTDLSGFQPNVEAIAGYEPDLVLLSSDPGDVVDGLAALGVPTLVFDAAATLDDTYAQIEVLGAATGHVGDAAELVSQMQADIDRIVADAPEGAEGMTYYHELSPDYYSITSDTFIGEIYGYLGLTSIGDAADGAADAGGYPQLSAEFIVDADPDFIFLADAQCCDQSPEAVAERPGWNVLSAVTDDRVIVVDEDVASRWGPRTVDFLDDVADEVGAAVGAG